MAGALANRREQMFPRLSEPQLGRLAQLGDRRKADAGTIVFEQGDVSPSFYVVLSGRMDIVQPVDGAEVPITVHEPGEFTGEVNMLAGRRTLVRARMSEAGELLVIQPETLRRIVQTDPELSELFLRAFILRRVALIDQAQGDTVLIGSVHNAATLRIREFLTRNAQPHMYLDLEREGCVQKLFERFHLRPEDVPVVICRFDRVLKNPTISEVADCLGMSGTVDGARVRDVVVVGAGPAGLAAAVYGASEGLDVLVLESSAPGGQAGSSSKIENYLGFPTGISGQALAGRALTQAQKFGAEIAIARSAAHLACERRPYVLELDGGGSVQARAVVIATGAQYRKLPLPELAKFENVGVYYGASHLEAQLCAGEEVIIVGGGNSAGQAAVFLSETVRHVHILVRGKGLADTMSQYLIHRIESSPKITLRAFTEIVALEGEGGLERVHIQDRRKGEGMTLPIRHVFLMTGAEPNTGWLRDCGVAVDEKGFVRTGQDLSPEDLAKWPLERRPWLLETNRHGIFAVGDVRASSVKRVASAVGEGSICIQLVHRVLAE